MCRISSLMQAYDASRTVFVLRSNGRRHAMGVTPLYVESTTRTQWPLYVESTTRTQCYVMAVMPVCREVYERLEFPGFGMAVWQRYHDRQDRGNFANY